MHRNLNIRTLLFNLILGLALLAPSLAHAVKVPYKVNLIRPPATILEGVGSLAIAEIDGQYGSQMASAIRTSLQAPVRGDYDGSDRVLEAATDIRVFDLVERERLGAIRAEGGSSAAAGAVVLGHVDVVGPYDNWTDEIRTVVKVVNGERYTHDVKYYCLERQLEVTTSLRVVDAGDSRILQEFSPSKAQAAKDCQPERDEVRIPAAEVMVGASVDAIGLWFANQIAPRWDNDNLFLVKDKTVKKAVQDLKKGHIDDAVALGQLYQILEQDPYNHLAIFDIGTIHEWYGDLDEALTRYQKANSINGQKPYRDAIERVQQRMAEADALARLGLNVRGTPPAPAGFNPGGKAARMMTVKAAKTKRVPVFAAPDEASSVVVQLPGQMSIEVTNEEGAFLEVRAPDGATGYVLARNLR